MRILVIGNGGREHALAWKLAQSSRVHEVLVAPGNAGTACEQGVRNVDVAATDLDALLELAMKEQVALTVVGPEVSLVAGVVDHFRAAGLRIFGPSAAASKLEGSKAFAKDFLRRYQIPTAHYAVFTDFPTALNYIQQHDLPLVIKADGLAAGKGVVVAHTMTEAEQALHTMFDEQTFGSGARVVIEEYLVGEEASYIVLSDGQHVLPLVSSQDHKRRDAGDQGPNTGGMGAYSPVPFMTSALEQCILEQIVMPTLRGMVLEGTPFVGCLYVGLMIDARGQPKVIEFNVRFGDPETQPIMLRLQSDLLELFEATLDGHLQQTHAQWDRRSSLGVVMASGGYPGKVETGRVIEGLNGDSDAATKIFHAGTRLDTHGQIVTCGGRVLTVCALGSDISDARARAYTLLEKIHFDGAFSRPDIAYRAVRCVSSLSASNTTVNTVITVEDR